MTPKRPSKLSNLMEAIRSALASGRYLYSEHVHESMFKRHLSVGDVKRVLTTGFHEKKKDKYEEMHESWNYAIKGCTVDERNVRVVVAFDKETHLIIITAIDLDKD